MAAMDLTTNVYQSDSFDVTGITVIIYPSEESLQYLIGAMFNWQGNLGTPANHGLGIFSSLQDMADYYISINATVIVNAVDAISGRTGSTLGVVHKNIFQAESNALDSKVDKTTTVNGHALNANVVVDYNDLTNKPTITSPKAYEGTTLRTGAFPIFKSATVGSGSAVFHLTADGTSGGTALFPNGVIQDSVNAFVSDAAASYQMAYAFSNSNKTCTVTTNKLTTANILTGILGQASGNGSVVKLSVWGY